jgi:transcriptional regulator with XRE-family HTH domain
MASGDDRTSGAESDAVATPASSVFPGFREIGAGRRRLLGELVARRRGLGLSQTEVAARMRTSQSAVARLEAQAGDLRLSTLERYAAALGQHIEWRLAAPAPAPVAAASPDAASDARAAATADARAAAASDARPATATEAPVAGAAVDGASPGARGEAAAAGARPHPPRRGAGTAASSTPAAPGLDPPPPRGTEERSAPTNGDRR